MPRMLWDVILIISLPFKWNPKGNFQTKSLVLKLLSSNANTKTEIPDTTPPSFKAHSNVHNGIMGLS